MKFMMMMHAPRAGWKESGIGTWPPADIRAHIAFMMRFNEELTASGELVDAQGLALPDEARVVRAAPKSGEPVVTDGPFAEAKEFLAGFWIIDVRAGRARLRASPPDDLGGAGQGRRAAEHADRGAPGDEQAARGPVMPSDLDAGGTDRPGAEQLLRTLAPQVLGAVIRRFGDFASAEDAVQEALLAAAMQWPEQGVPEHPRAWLIQVASRRMTDHVRREIARRRRETVVFEERQDDLAPAADRDAATAHDDTLILLFMCAHPALSEHAAIALTLRAVGGLTTAEIASAFLVPESTMAQRISRAKQAIRKSGVPFSLPGDGERAARLTAVLHVLYLIFSEGYVSSAGRDADPRRPGDARRSA